MCRYNEIMRHVEVTEEMRSRILKNVDEHFIQKKRSRKRTLFLVLGNMTVAAAIILFVVIPWNNSLPVTDTGNDEIITGGTVMSGYGSQEYTSVEELSATVGFDVPQIKSIPFEVQETLYLSQGKDSAEIDYTNETESISFRKSVGIEDNSGVYYDYSVEKQVQLSGMNITLKGDQDIIYLAIWNDATYAYSIYSDIGLSEDVMIQLVTEVVSG